MSSPTRADQCLHPVIADASRLAALRRTALLDSPTEESFDRLTRLAARTVGAPIALVTLVDEDRQFFKSQCGLPEPWASRRETPLSYSFCQHPVTTREPFVVEDATLDPRVRENLAVRDLEVISYLGVPLITHEGYELGALCVIDRTRRSWSAEEVRVVGELAEMVLTEIELRCTAHALKEEVTAMRAREALARLGGHPPSPAGDARQEEEARAARIQALAHQARQRLESGTASLVDVAFHPRDILWLTSRVLDGARADAAGAHSGPETPGTR